MRCARTLFVIVCVAVLISHAQIPTRISKEGPSFRKPGTQKPTHAKPLIAQAPLLSTPALATLSASVTSVTCSETTASFCGYIPVPLDREHPNGAQLQIYFEVYPHTAVGEAESAIMVNLGLPGPGTTQGRDYFQFLFGPNLDVHDLLLVDDRGTAVSLLVELQTQSRWSVGT